MFRALPYSSSGGLRRNCIYAASGIVTLQKVSCLKLLCYRLFVCWYRLLLVVWSCRFYYSRWPHCFIQFYFDLFLLVYLSCLFCIANLDDWLTVHRSITLVNFEFDAQNSYLFIYNKFIKILYMFRALPCSSSGGLRRNCVCAAYGIVTLQKSDLSKITVLPFIRMLI